MKFYSIAVAITISSAAATSRGKGGKGKGGKRKSKKGSKSPQAIEEADMDVLVNAFCSTVVAISYAFWENGGQNAIDGTGEIYPQAACDAAYDVALGALNGAYNYPDPVLFKPTLTTAPFTFRPTKAGALSYFIGTDCLLKSGSSEDFSDNESQYPPGNTGAFREYGFGLGNYRTGYLGFDDCEWNPDGYVTGEGIGLAQGQVAFTRTEGEIATVDKTWGFGISRDGGVVITAHHSSAVIDPDGSTQYEGLPE